MAILPTARNNGGVPRAQVVCDDCQKTEIVACDYEGPQSNKRPKESQAINKVTARGWTQVKGKLRCPTCEAKRKVVKMRVKEEPVPEPTKAQKRQIMQMLEDTYDAEAERYQGAETDDSVAAVLGVRPGWVAELREEFFGPAGSNVEIEELAKRVETHLEKSAEAIKAAQTAMAEVEAIAKEINRIRSALSPRIKKAAGING